MVKEKEDKFPIVVSESGLHKDKKEPHPHLRKDKGVTIDFGDRCVFLKPGQTYKDTRGRRYKVAEDGSLRRIKED